MSSIRPDDLSARLETANREFTRRYPGEGGGQQPVHTVYVGAHEVLPRTTRAWGDAALAALEEHAPDATAIAEILGSTIELAEIVHPRIVEKLTHDPVEDLRVDFEDGYGVRSDEEEDAHCDQVAKVLAEAQREGTLPAFFGVRVKPLNEDARARSMRTTRRFLRAFVEAFGGDPPDGLVLTLAKVTVPEQVAVFAELLGRIEKELGLADRALRFEIMIEVAQAVIDARGQTCVRALVDAGHGRCFAAHLGTYDYTASCGITAAHQSMSHPACDFAKAVMQASLAGTGVFLSDGSTNVLPVGTPEEILYAWQLHAADVRASLVGGFYQGWDMHPVQLVTRFAALYAFYLEALPRATARMRALVLRASKASAHGGVADDAATGQALLNFFLRGLACGAVSEREAQSSGLTLDEIRGRSFANVLAARRGL